MWGESKNRLVAYRARVDAIGSLRPLESLLVDFGQIVGTGALDFRASDAEERGSVIHKKSVISGLFTLSWEHRDRALSVMERKAVSVQGGSHVA